MMMLICKDDGDFYMPLASLPSASAFCRRNISSLENKIYLLIMWARYFRHQWSRLPAHVTCIKCLSPSSHLFDMYSRLCHALLFGFHFYVTLVAAFHACAAFLLFSLICRYLLSALLWYDGALKMICCFWFKAAGCSHSYHYFHDDYLMPEDVAFCSSGPASLFCITSMPFSLCWYLANAQMQFLLMLRVMLAYATRFSAPFHWYWAKIICTY